MSCSLGLELFSRNMTLLLQRMLSESCPHAGSDLRLIHYAKARAVWTTSTSACVLCTVMLLVQRFVSQSLQPILSILFPLLPFPPKFRFDPFRSTFSQSVPCPFACPKCFPQALTLTLTLIIATTSNAMLLDSCSLKTFDDTFHDYSISWITSFDKV